MYQYLIRIVVVLLDKLFIYNFKKYLNKDEIKFINDHQSGWMKKYKDAWYLINK